MPKIVPIVEGKGEEIALPNLLYKLLHGLGRYDIQVATPRNANGGSNLKRVGGLEHFVQAAIKEPDCAALLVLLDADADCPKMLARHFADRVLSIGASFPTAIVLAKCEYEAWFLASLETLTNRVPGKEQSGLLPNSTFTGDIESKPGVKEWLSKQFPPGRSYKHTEHQLLFTQKIDIELAKANSRSFRRLSHAVEEIIAAIDSGTSAVTPAALEAR